MPKIPTKTKKAIQQQSNRLNTKDLANRLLQVSSVLQQAKKELELLWEVLYTRGLTECGPITEDKDDIPF